MDISMERSGEGANIGSLFQQIINDMKNTSPLWEDFVTKATKLHSCLRATIAAIASYLEAFQKIADAATSSKGASKEIGSALTRVCLRHKAVETRLKTFTTAIMDCLILPLQENIEDWKKQVAFIDKEHAKEHKRCRSELKKRSTDTLRLQKKARKGQHQGSHLQDNLQSLVDSSMQDVNARRAELDEVERKSLRTVMIEERMRYCTFVYMLQPVVKEECEVMYELGHLQEVMQNIGHVTKDPHTLPQASEDLILESKTSLYPDSPGGSNSQACSNSLGSRKSSVCSISSINSNSSGSPGHQFQRSLSQYSPVIRLRPGESKDSGFCSSPALALQAATSSNQSHPVTTWPPQSQDPANDSRPHTISTAYEKGHQRPPLTVYTFQSPDSSNTCTAKAHEKSQNRPPLPVRCSSLERPLSSSGLRNSSNSSRQCPSPIPSHIAKAEYSGSSSASSAPQPTYVNMAELVSMAANRITNHLSQASFRELDNLYTTAKPQSNSQQPNSPVLSSTSASSLVSPDSSATNPISAISSPDAVSLAGTIHETPQITPQNTSPQTPQAVVARDHDLNRDGDITPGYGSQCIIPTNERVVEKALSKSQFDSKTVGSVLEKANLFETLEKQQKEKPVQLREEVIYRRRDESYKSTSASASERDSESNIDPIDKDTIEELNNLIGELDLFQKEHEEMEKKLNEKLGYCNNARSDCLNENHSDASSDRNEKLSYLSSDTLPVSHLTKDNGTTATTKWSWKFQNNEYIDNEMLSYVPDDSMGDFSGYENPSFVHLNDKEIVVIRENAFPNEIDAYNHNHSEVITLNCTAQTSSMQQLDEIGRSDSPLQRFSSFRSDTPPMPLSSQNNSLSSVLNDSGSNESSPVYHQSPARLRHSSSLLEDKPRLLQSSKPAANPRPASLSGANVTRIARRASVNTVKPPPPVRRSSSVTPAHNLDNQSPAVSTQNLMTSSSENLPPPPAYLLDTGNQLVPGNVAGTVKALNEIKHTPASPGVLRRVQHQAESQVILKPSNASYPSYHSSPPPVEPRNSSGIYAKPQLQQVQNTSSFKQQTSQTSQKPQGILSQIASRINSSKHQQQSTQQVSNNFQSYYGSRNQPEPVYVTQESARFGHENQNSLQLKPTEGKKKSHIPSITPTSSSTYNHPHYQQGAKYQRPDQSQFISGRNYVSTNPFLTSPPSSSNSYGGPNSHPNYLPSSFGKSPPAHQSNYLSEVRSTTNAGSVISKTSAGFLENLNQKLAEQRLSGKAYAVRSYINSHTLPASENNYTCVPIEYESIVMTSNNIPAINPCQYSNYPRNLCEASVNQNFSQKHHRNAIKNNIHGQGSQNSPRNVQMQVSQPDPRVCHESLMDQIKKGATLKRNRTCNDRSAPKIH